MSHQMQFTVATYNIHKGFSHLTRRMVIHELKEKLHGLSADLLFLQEVQGVHHRNAGRYHDWPGKPQHEFIADTMWREVAYGRNAVYRNGHHGNALLSRFPMLSHENEDISAHAFETRGILHCEIRISEKAPVLHCLNVHLGPLRARPAVADPGARRPHPRDGSARRADDHRRRLQRLAPQGGSRR